ncbi:MAG: carboxypeptidase-like regulatory domain-containing protein [Chloroflexota bacterium]|nr:carboxypeptidase-like regulatory domain-containing protein [Chloroflexota bacterium]
MPGRSSFDLRVFLVPAVGLVAAAASIALAGHGAAAQAAAGSVTGRVVWGPCLRSLPLPVPAEGAEAPEGAQPERPEPGEQRIPPDFVRPPRFGGLPAGAVLVAVQGTSISTRTDDAGRFSLSGVPAGQYLTVAAGPVADSNAATAARPNVLVNGGQSVDIGVLSLGGPTSFGVGCAFPSMPGPAAPEAPRERAPGEP